MCIVKCGTAVIPTVAHEQDPPVMVYNPRNPPKKLKRKEDEVMDLRRSEQEWNFGSLQVYTKAQFFPVGCGRYPSLKSQACMPPTT